MFGTILKSLIAKKATNRLITYESVSKFGFLFGVHAYMMAVKQRTNKNPDRDMQSLTALGKNLCPNMIPNH